MKLLVVVGSLLASWSTLFISDQQAPPQAQTELAASITGSVTLQGAPISGVLIFVRSIPPSPELASSAKTADNGQYRITNLRPGRYIVRAQAPGLASQEQSPSAFGRDVSLAPGEIRENIDFVLVRGGVIAGRVTDASGRPVVEEMIIITASANGPQPYFENRGMMRTDDRGFYRIYGLPPGRYKVSAGEGGGSRFRRAFFNSA